jgi:hypothetical protein
MRNRVKKDRGKPKAKARRKISEAKLVKLTDITDLKYVEGVCGLCGAKLYGELAVVGHFLDHNPQGYGKVKTLSDYTALDLDSRFKIVSELVRKLRLHKAKSEGTQINTLPTTLTTLTSNDK